MVFNWKDRTFGVEMVDVGDCCATSGDAKGSVLNDLKFVDVYFGCDGGPDGACVF